MTVKGIFPVSGSFEKSIDLKLSNDRKGQILKQGLKRSKASVFYNGREIRNSNILKSSKASELFGLATNKLVDESVGAFKIKGLAKSASIQKDQFAMIYAAYFQRLVARTPLDEDYDYYGEDGYLRHHKKDGDVARNDWIMRVNDATIKATDFPESYFYQFNDRTAIEDIGKKILAAIGKGKMPHTMSVENKNWKYNLLENGQYPGKGNGNVAVGGGNRYPHGTENGYSVQAKNGIKAVTDAELNYVAKNSSKFFQSYLSKENFEKEFDLQKYESYIKQTKNKKTYTDIDWDALEEAIAFYDSKSIDIIRNIFGSLDAKFALSDTPNYEEKSAALWNKVLNRRRQRKFYDENKRVPFELKAERSQYNAFKKAGVKYLRNKDGDRVYISDKLKTVNENIQAHKEQMAYKKAIRKEWKKNSKEFNAEMKKNYLKGLKKRSKNDAAFQEIQKQQQNAVRNAVPRKKKAVPAQKKAKPTNEMAGTVAYGNKLNAFARKNEKYLTKMQQNDILQKMLDTQKALMEAKPIKLKAKKKK